MTRASYYDAEGNRIIGAVLRELREDTGLSLEAAAERSNITTGSVLGSYERGDRTVSIDRLYQLAAFYEVDVHELLAVIEERRRVAALTDVERAAELTAGEFDEGLWQGMRAGTAS